MSTLFEMLVKGGPVMIPLGGLSIATVACTLERGLFWFGVLRGEDKTAHQVLDTARYDWDKAREIAEKSQHLAIARFMLAPLKLNRPSPETFRLAMEAAADREFIQMRKGDKLLETVVGMAPLFGLLGTVTGLIVTFLNLKIGGGANIDTTKAALGIAEALLTTAAGMVVALMALASFRMCVTLQARQIDYFAEIGSELELIYRQVWYEPSVDESLIITNEHLQGATDPQLVEQLATLIHQIARKS
jgi:biopolymer transport protein ExbB